ncbi:hypothetical protein [Nocardioides ultimimeridianus]
MIFWSIVAGIMALLLGVAWYVDRRHPGTHISRRQGGPETDLARGREASAMRIHQPFGPTGH